MKRSDIEVGAVISSIIKPDVNGGMVQVPSRSERTVLLTFFRFATCPFCNLRLRALQAFADNHPEIEVVGVFGSPKDEVAKSIGIHNLSFPLLSDTNGELYRQFGIRKSLWGVLKGMFGRFRELMKAMISDGFIPKKFDGHFLTMPAEFLISAKGEVLLAHYGKDEGDHVSLDSVLRVVEENG